MAQYGYRLDLENHDELQQFSTPFRHLVDGLFSAPPEIDPRPWHRIENQGEMGSCQGHAQSSVCEMAFHIATGQVIQFSPLFAYLATQKIDGLLGTDCGSTISGGSQCAMQVGCCPLEVMPYPNPVHYSYLIPSNAYAAASSFKIRSKSTCRSYDDVYSFLASGQGGVELGIAWGDSMTPDARGVIEQFRPGRGGHAVAFLGYSLRKDSVGRNYLWLPNSWGPDSWGIRGWAEVSPVAVDQMFAHPQTVMVGLSDLSVPRPRVIHWTGANSVNC